MTRRPGFTLIECLVVVLIVGVWVHMTTLRIPRSPTPHGAQLLAELRRRAVGTQMVHGLALSDSQHQVMQYQAHTGQWQAEPPLTTPDHFWDRTPLARTWPAHLPATPQCLWYPDGTSHPPLHAPQVSP